MRCWQAHKELDVPENAHLEEKIKIKPVQVGELMVGLAGDQGGNERV